MAYTVEILPKAKKQLAILPAEDRRRIGKKIDTLEVNPRPAGCIKLSGEDDLYRLRVGDYRLVFSIQDDILYVLVIRIGHRREVYRRGL